MIKPLLINLYFIVYSSCIYGYGLPKLIDEVKNNLVTDLSSCDAVIIGSLVNQNYNDLKRSANFKGEKAFFREIKIDLVIAARKNDDNIPIKKLIDGVNKNEETSFAYITGPIHDFGTNKAYNVNGIPVAHTKYLFFVKYIKDEQLKINRAEFDSKVFLEYSSSKSKPFQLEWSDKLIPKHVDKKMIANAKYEWSQIVCRDYFKSKDHQKALFLLHMIITNIIGENDLNYSGHIDQIQADYAITIEHELKNYKYTKFNYVCDIEDIKKIKLNKPAPEK